MDCARRVFKANVRNYEDWTYEWGVALYWTLQGRVVEGKPTMGEEQEVVVPDEPHLGIPVACIHSHLDNCELTDFDREQGQQEANKNGRFFIQCVMGWSNEQDGVAMSQEVFEPEIQEALAAEAKTSPSEGDLEELFGIGGLDAYGAVQFRPLTRDIYSSQSHGQWNPTGRWRFRYARGTVEWTDCASTTPEQRQEVADYLEARGYPVLRQETLWDRLDREDELGEAATSHAAQESRSHDVVKALLDSPDEDQWREISRGQAQHIQEAFEAKGNKLTGTVSIGSADFRQRDGNWQRRLRGEQQRQESEEPPGRLIALAIRKAKKSSKYWSHE